MRVALCLSGLPRAVETSFESIKRNILDRFDVDIFIHTWLEDPYRAAYTDVENWDKMMPPVMSLEKKMEIINKVVCLYKPKSYKLDVCHVYKGYNNNIHTRNYKIHPRYGSMYESIYLVNELKKYYEQRNRFTYDCVIRCRLDVNMDEFIDYSVYDLSKGVYVRKMNNQDVSFEINDCFAFSSSKRMDDWCELFSKLDEVVESITDPRTFGRCDAHIPLARWNTIKDCNAIPIDFEMSLNRDSNKQDFF